MDPEEPENNSEINVEIKKPQLKTQLGGASKFYVYEIEGKDKFSGFTVYRRFSDFVILKNLMIVRWPGCYVPALPEKKFLGNNEAPFVEIRRQGLQRFLQLISQAQHLWYSDEFQLFIKNTNSDIEKSLGNLGKTNPRQIHAKYKTVFSVFPEEAEGEANTKINEFTSYLKGVTSILQKLIKTSESMNESRNKFTEKYNSLFQVFLYDYEQKCIKEYADEKQKQNLSFFNQGQNGVRQLRQKLGQAYAKSSISMANELIKEELRQVINFQEILKIREEYQAIKAKSIAKVKDLELQESKINAGKESLFSKLKSTPKEKQLEENKAAMEKAKEEEDQATTICQIVEYMLRQKQIDSFKKVRKENYYKVVKEIAKAEKAMYEVQTEFWEKICGDNLNSKEEQEEEVKDELKEEIIQQVEKYEEKIQTEGQKVIDAADLVEQEKVEQKEQKEQKEEQREKKEEDKEDEDKSE